MNKIVNMHKKGTRLLEQEQNIMETDTLEITDEMVDTDDFGSILREAMDTVRTEGAPAVATAALSRSYDKTKMLMGAVVEYKELMMMYSCALKTVSTKLEVLDTEFKAKLRRNPISSISSRLKTTRSIVDKLARKGQPFTIESIESNIYDVAGIRVICPYMDDIYTLADALLRQDDVKLLSRKDYIANPKPNGYRSLHLIISLPVYFSDRMAEIPVEVQIRTIAMDFWASLEHQLKYKQDIPNQQEIIEQLRNCADTIHMTDAAMLGIRRQIENLEDTPTEDDVLLEKFSRLDLAVGQ